MSNDEKHMVEIPIGKIHVNPYQPRKQFDEKKLQELASSITQYGVFSPLLVRESLNGYQLLAGERRLRAAQLAGLETVPAIVKQYDDKAMIEIALLENIQRDDLTPLDEAKAYKKIMDRYDYTQEELADHIGKSRGHVSNYLRLLSLPLAVQDKLNSEKLSVGHAKVLLSAYTYMDKTEADSIITLLAKKIIDEGLSVRKTEAIMNKLSAETHKNKKNDDIYINDLIRNIQLLLSTKVEISTNKLSISFSDYSDLNRILEILNLIELDD